MNYKGLIRKMKAHLDNDGIAQYSLPIGDQSLPLNQLIGSTVTLQHSGIINCISCGAKIKKTYNQGYCFMCTQTLAACDICIIKPELCHYDKGTCREPEWGEKHCLIPHTVYLANSSGLKVGVTRAHQQVTRWIDQGASQAVKIAETTNRLEAGKVEVSFKELLQDKTNWRKMLKEEPESIDLEHLRSTYQKKLEISATVRLETTEPPVQIKYPVDKYPDKITSLNLDKNPEINSKLNGIKGQYLIFESGVINMRKYAGYELIVSTES